MSAFKNASLLINILGIVHGAIARDKVLRNIVADHDMLHQFAQLQDPSQENLESIYQACQNVTLIDQEKFCSGLDEISEVVAQKHDLEVRGLTNTIKQLESKRESLVNREIMLTGLFIVSGIFELYNTISQIQDDKVKYQSYQDSLDEILDQDVLKMDLSQLKTLKFQITSINAHVRSMIEAHKKEITSGLVAGVSLIIQGVVSPSPILLRVASGLLGVSRIGCSVYMFVNLKEIQEMNARLSSLEESLKRVVAEKHAPAEETVH